MFLYHFKHLNKFFQKRSKSAFIIYPLYRQLDFPYLVIMLSLLVTFFLTEPSLTGSFRAGARGAAFGRGSLRPFSSTETVGRVGVGGGRRKVGLTSGSAA
jgi:hypothetical protein